MSQQTSIDWGTRLAAMSWGRNITIVLAVAITSAVAYSSIQQRRALAQYPETTPQAVASPTPQVQPIETIEQPIQNPQYSMNITGMTTIVTPKPMKCINGNPSTVALCWWD